MKTMKTMKKIMLFAAACVALAACNKEIDTTTSTDREAVSFEKGQLVTLSVSAGEQTKVSSELETSGADKDKVNFKWETGDKIKVSVGGESAEFTLSSGEGTSEGSFVGEMPAGGNTFDVQYPYGGVEASSLASQEYSATEALPHDKMLFKATGCTSNDVTLTAQYAALRLNLYGYETVGKIVVTNTSSAAATKPTYTLDCEAGASIAATENNATPFFIIMPISATPADNTYKLKVEVSNNDSSPVKIGSFETSDVTFTANKVLNMPKRLVFSEVVDLGLSVKWASCNLGASVPTEYGKYYPWGPVEGKYWPITNWEWSYGSSPYVVLDGAQLRLDSDPVQYEFSYENEWRLPTQAEFQELFNADNCSSKWINNGYLFTSKKTGYEGKSIFIPAAGYVGTGPTLNYAGSDGYYWSSTMESSVRIFHCGGRCTPRMDNSSSYVGNTIRPVIPKS